MVVMMKELRGGERLAGVVRPGRIHRDRRALGWMHLRAHFVVQSAEHRAVPHTEMVALGQGDRAGGARETADVEHEVSGSHHQLRGKNCSLTPGATFHTAEHTET